MADKFQTICGGAIALVAVSNTAANGLGHELSELTQWFTAATGAVAGLALHNKVFNDDPRDNELTREM